MTDTITREGDRLHNVIAGACTEDFWEYIRANISAEECSRRCAGRGVDVSPADIREARMRDAACAAFDRIQQRGFIMVQPC